MSLKIPENPWTKPPEKLLEALNTDPVHGLDLQSAEERLKIYGSNSLRKIEKEPVWRILLNQLKSILVILLLVAVIISFIFSEWLEGISILAVIIINTVIGFLAEFRAIRSMEALSSLTTTRTRVLREGEVSLLEAKRLVPGDIVIIEAGDIITADMRIVTSSKLQVNESTLTGESVPVEKAQEALEASVPLAERYNMLFKGTAITRGTGKGLVVSTGMNTELGKISKMIGEAQVAQLTPLEKRLKILGRKLIWVLLIIIVIVAISSLLVGKSPFLVIETSIALAVATVPEGLPIIATIVLARGMHRMAKSNALVNKLSTVETLGSTNIICTDKTGTITENKMTVDTFQLSNSVINVKRSDQEHEGEFLLDGEPITPSDYENLSETLKIGLLCNNASLKRSGEEIGDPLEVALLIVAAKADMNRREYLKKFPECREVSFDPSIKLMATFHQEDNAYLVAVKGAPEAVIEKCRSIQIKTRVAEFTSTMKSSFLEKNDQMAQQGLRIIALAKKIVTNVEQEPYTDLIFLGLVGMRDPPRKGIQKIIKICQTAGIRFIMITGDHKLTAKYIAKETGIITSGQGKILSGKKLRVYEDLSENEVEEILQTTVFARVEPSQKLYLIDIHQKQGSVVAMTGDGVNDAPALKKADIGIAMGQHGTQVAKEAADMILEDDDLSTIVDAVKHGRIIFDNIRNFIIYLLSCNLSEILIIFFASFLPFPLPLLPLQILYLNVVTDIFPAFALGANKGRAGVMNEAPRKLGEAILPRSYWVRIIIYSAIIAISVLGAYLFALFILQKSANIAITIAFLTLALAQTWHVFNIRDRESTISENQIVRNKYVWVAIVTVVGLLLLAIYLPGLSFILHVVDPGFTGWLLSIGMSLCPLFLIQVWIFIATRRKKEKNSET
ncbi:MAG: cation-translocating P-type ATPase [Promethearchaeota archaeon]